jgi:hypothetical protein
VLSSPASDLDDRAFRYNPVMEVLAAVVVVATLAAMASGKVPAVLAVGGSSSSRPYPRFSPVALPLCLVG